LPRRAASRERGLVSAAWSLTACARAEPPWGWDDSPCLPCHPGPACPSSQNERGLAWSSTAPLPVSRVPVASPSGGGRGEDGMFLAFI
jgi:hypothetical protein